MVEQRDERASLEQRQRVLCALATGLVSELDRDRLFQRIADAARELTEAEYAALGVADEQGRLLQFITSGITEADRESIGHLPVGRGILGALIREARPIRLRDMTQDPRFVGFPPNHPPMRSFLGVPIVSRGRVVGDLYLTNKIGGEEFSDEDQGLAELLAAFAASAMHNSELHFQVVQQRDELALLHQVDQAILSSRHEAELIARIVEEAARAYQAKCCVFFEPAPDLRSIRVAAASGLSPDQMRFLESSRADQGAVGWALSTAQPIFSSDVFQDRRFSGLWDIMREVGVQSCSSAPVVLGGRIVGVVCLGFPEVTVFPASEGERLTRLATQVALGLQNVQYLSQIHAFGAEAIIALAESIEHRDPYTGGHCRRLGLYSRALAEALGLSPSDQEVAQYGAILHDIGKIGVADAILLKPGPLTPDEWVQMRLHPVIGSQIARKVGFLEPMAPLIYHHHERYDGAGYVDGLRGERIPLGSRIIAVVDAYDAMTNDRPYRAALSQQDALEEIRGGSGSQFDPQVVQAFRDLAPQLRELERGQT